MGKGRTSKYPILLIEKEFIHKRLTLKELSEKYGASIDLLSYHSRRHNWLKRRKEVYKKVTIKLHNELDNKEIRAALKGEMTLIERFEKLLKLKLDAEMRVFVNTADEKTKKDLMYLVNKSKDSTTEIAKLLELLKGNATERVDLPGKEKVVRYNRLKQFVTAN